MSAPALPQGLIKISKLLTAFRDSQIADEETDAQVVRVVVPFRFELHRVDYSITAGDTAGTVTDLAAKIGGSLVTEKVAPAAGPGVKNGSLNVLKPYTSYPPGTVIEVVATTGEDSTIDDAAFTFTVRPIDGI